LSVEGQIGQYNSPKVDQSYAISQNIPFPTIFKARRQIYNNAVNQKTIELAISANELVKQVRSYYYQIQYLENNALQLQGLDSLYQDFIRIATVRYKAGDIKKVEINTAETQQGEINLLWRQNEVLLSNAYENLKTLLYTKDDLRIKKRKEYKPMSLDVVLDSSLIANHPLVRFYENEANRQEANKRLEKAEGLPDFSLGVTNQSLIGEHVKNGVERYYGNWNRFTSVTIGVGIPITYGATKSRIKALEFEKQAAQQNTLLVKQQLNADFKTMMNQYKQDVEQYDYYKNQAIPNALMIVKASQLGYQTGEISYVEYLFALQTATTIKLKYLESIQKVNESVVNINYIINQ